MQEQNRRQFNRATLSSLLTFSLLETLATEDLFSAETKSVTGKWLADLHDLGNDLKGKKLSQSQWQEHCEGLFKKVDLEDLLKFIDFGGRISSVPFREKGERAISFKFPEVEGLPTNLIFGHQVFKMKKGQSVVPHGHDNMATGFVVLKGSFHGRHYDRLEDTDTHMIIRPTIDDQFKAAQYSTISDHKDNVHWFEATSDEGYIFNIHVINLEEGKGSGRVHIDPNGERLKGGRIKARRISASEAVKLYG